MPDSAFQEKFRRETIMGFEKRQSLARRTVTTEAMMEGNRATFLVADSGGASAVTRGINGDIPTRPDNLNQFTCTLREWHDIPERTNFNIFASQGEGRRIMQQTSMAVINRKIDNDIHTELSNATLNWGAAQALNPGTNNEDISQITLVKTKLMNNFATEDAPLYALITPAFYGQMMKMKQFVSADYIQDKKFEGVPKDRAFSWYGVNWIVDAGLPGVGTANESCFMFSQLAIGHAANTSSMVTEVGYDAKFDKSWARCSIFMGSKLLQNSGIIKMPHNATGLV